MSEAEMERRARENPEWWSALVQQVALTVEDDHKATQLAYYRPANPMAGPAHLSMAREVALVGGNRSSKTDTMMAELAIQLTGHIPLSLMGSYPRAKLRAPIRARIVCNSLTDTLEPVIKPKLRWDQWNGVGDPKDGRGHWGWIPRHCLAGGSWEKAYSEKYRTLTVNVDSFWRGPGGEVNSMRGYSTCQFLSYDQDLSAFAGSSMHFIGHDELPPSDIYRENRMRTLDVKGTMWTAFTPPDEAGISRGDVTDFFENVYERGLPGPEKDPNIDTFILHTEKNAILDSDEISLLASRMTEAQREVRLRGAFIHLSGVIYNLFAKQESQWCFACAKRIFSIRGTCPSCTSTNIVEYQHVVEPFKVPQTWPVVFVIDPHPRKKDAMGWFAVAPSDDLFMIHELEMDGTAEDVAREVRRWEDANGVRPVKRLMDPNIATETNDKLQRGWTMRRAYDEVGLRCDLATDDVNTGIQEVIGALRPDVRTRRPRLAFFSTCHRAIDSHKNWSWEEWSRPQDKEVKEKPRDKYKDFCDVARYFIMDRPSYHGYQMSGLVYRPRR